MRELEKIYQQIQFSLQSVRVILLSFLIIVCFLIWVMHLKISLYIPFLILFWELTTFLFFRIIKQRKEVRDVNNIHFAYFIFEFFLLTMIIHFMGGVEGLGAVFYVFFIVYAVFLFPRERGMIIGLLAFVFYTVLSFLECFGIIKHYEFLGLGEYYDPFYVASMLIISGASLGLIFLATEYFAEDMRKNKDELLVLYKQLQEKTEKLEAINKFAIGRELKMVELKEENKQMREKAEKPKKK